MQEHTFGSLLKHYRILAGFKTLKQLADALTDEGLIYSESLLSRWQKDSRLPKDRDVFLILIKIFITQKGIKNVYQANQLLSSAGMGYLSIEEVNSLLLSNRIKLELEMDLYEKFSPRHTPVNQQQPDEDQLIKISLSLPKNLDRYLDWVSLQYKTSRAESLRQILDKQIST